MPLVQVVSSVCQPFEIEYGKGNRLIRVFPTSFVKASYCIVRKHRQAGICRRAFPELLFDRPCTAFVITEADSHVDTFRVGGIGEEDAVSALLIIEGIAQ